MKDNQQPQHEDAISSLTNYIVQDDTTKVVDTGKHIEDKRAMWGAQFLVKLERKQDNTHPTEKIGIRLKIIKRVSGPKETVPLDCRYRLDMTFR